MYLLIVLLPLLASSIFGRFIGSEGVSRLDLLFCFFFFLIAQLVVFGYFRKYFLKGMTQWCYLALVCQVSLFLILLRSHILTGFGTFCADVGTIFFAYAVTGSPGEIVNHQAGTSSEWLTYTSDMVEDSASSGRSSSVNQPIQREQAGPSNAFPAPAPAAQQQNHLDQPFGEGGEREARAQEHARVSAEVEKITNACESLEAAMVRKAHILLHERGITLADPEDIKRALQLALHDDWEHDIDSRQRHFTMLKRDFGTTRCERWNPFIDELRGLGNHQVNAKHYVD
uniref:Uncharacterized protein n=1 Tax=Capsella bursa-pastoris TaxID=3719 RepID=A0A6H1YJJ7_CAPBU|nr:hypothetical protein [Capsella bursa-pastoris]